MPSTSLEDLARGCVEETARYRAGDLSTDEQFCYELLRRAFGERSNEAFTHVYTIYHPQVLRWIQAHPLGAMLDDPPEDVANTVLLQWWRALSKPQKFEDFQGVAPALKYLKCCINNEILRQKRRKESRGERLPELSIDMAPAIGVSDDPDVVSQEVLQRVDVLLPRAGDRLLVRASFIWGLKPREIARLFSNEWPNPKAVTDALYRVRTTLRLDPTIQRLLGVQDSHGDEVSDPSKET